MPTMKAPPGMRTRGNRCTCTDAKAHTSTLRARRTRRASRQAATCPCQPAQACSRAPRPQTHARMRQRTATLPPAASPGGLAATNTPRPAGSPGAWKSRHHKHPAQSHVARRRGAHLGDGEAGAAVGVVHGHVQAGAEEVLVHLGVEAGRQEGAVGGLGPLARAQAVGAQAPRQLHLVLDAAILVPGAQAAPRSATALSRGMKRMTMQHRRQHTPGSRRMHAGNQAGARRLRCGAGIDRVTAPPFTPGRSTSRSHNHSLRRWR